ncbi:MAG: 30S ribosomal protein S2 [Planctomycetia bacterium]
MSQSTAPSAPVQLTAETLIENGVHFGHRASRWNPKMRRYIHSKRNAIHIIDLQQTVRGLVRACHFLRALSAEGGKILIVGTKRSAKDAVRAVAERTQMPYVTERWLGGTLTNFRTIRTRLERLAELEADEASAEFAEQSKKAQARVRTEKKKILKNLEGVRDLTELPAALLVVDPRNEHIAVDEANKMRIPVIALLDTDCDPDPIDILIPGNDDAMRSVSLILGRAGDAMEEGLKEWRQVEAEREKAEAERRREEEAKREQERQRKQVEIEWQKKLRAEADKRRAEGDAAAAPSGEAPQA